MRVVRVGQLKSPWLILILLPLVLVALFFIAAFMIGSALFGGGRKSLKPGAGSQGSATILDEERDHDRRTPKIDKTGVIDAEYKTL